MVYVRPILRSSQLAVSRKIPNPSLLAELPGLEFFIDFFFFTFLLIETFFNFLGPAQYPIVGNLPSYWLGKYDRFRYQKVLQTLYREYGPVVKENFGDRTIVHVFDPEDIKTVSCLSQFEVV